MGAVKLYFLVATVFSILLVFSEQCNVGLGNRGFGNVGVGNSGIGNRGVFNSGFKNIGVLNRKSIRTIGVGNIFSNRRIGVASILTVPNLLPAGRKK